MRDFDFAGKTVLVTGASMGIGAEFARELSRLGSTVVLVARSKEKLEALAGELKRAHVVVEDLSAPGAAQRVFAAVTKLGLQIDVLVNNAGFGLHGPFGELSGSGQREMVDLNVGALVELTYAFLPMIEAKKGGVIQVASVAAFQPIPYMATYGATKAFVLSFSEALWAEYRARDVRILCLCPGTTETAFFERSGEGASAGQPKAPAIGVVRTGIKAFRAGRSYIVDGTNNWLMSTAARFFPREMTAKITAKMTAPKPAAALKA